MSAKVQVQYRIERKICNTTNKLKWHLYFKSDIESVGCELIHAFTHLHHAKARMFKMAAVYQSYHYIVVNDCNEIVEQEIVGLTSADKPELSPEETITKQPDCYQKVVYRIVKYAPDFFVVDYQTWLSTTKDIVNVHTYDYQNIGEYPNRTQAIDAITRHADSYPAYTIITAGIKGKSTHLMVYHTEDVYKSHQKDLWFSETVAPAESATHAGATVSPPSNTGGLNQIEDKQGLSAVADPPDCLIPTDIELAALNISEIYAHKVMEGGVLKTVMLRRGLNTPAFIDTLSFTMLESSFHKLDDNGQWITGDRAVLEAIHQVSQIMGINAVKETSGKNAYLYGLQFGDNEGQDRNFGFVCWGGESQNGSIMFHFTGDGLTYARDGWEKYLFLFLSKFKSSARITRIDISHDFLHGQYTVPQAVIDWKDDCYTVRNTKPQAECQGTDWLSDTNKGKTFYIGSKKSSRILYFYEKGKQLGDEDSPWVRVELRQRNKDYIIPFNVLLHAGDYLCTAYPHLAKVLDYDFAEQNRFHRIKKANGIAEDHVIKYAKMQVSPAIKMLQSLGLDNDGIIKRLLNPKAKLPKRLQIKNPKGKDD